MNEKDKTILLEADKVIGDVKAKIAREKERHYITYSILNALKPIFAELNKTTKESVSQYLQAIKEIKLLPPSVSVKPTDVIVERQNLPPVSVPKAEVKVEVPEIKLPDIKMPEINTKDIEKAIITSFKKIPASKINIEPLKMPKEMSVKGIKELSDLIIKALNKKQEVSNEPMSAMLVDEKGKPYKALTRVATGGGGGGVVSVRGDTSPQVINVAMATANKEYSQELPNGTKKIDIKLRALNALLKIAFVVGQSGSNYTTIPYGSSYHAENINLNGTTIYLQSPSANQTAEILAWT